ncbi:MAG: hypothetical protein UT41_C0003G0099 [Candidatus Wolfebacteria bacterium GW2011_GWC2_39_22]|uniref:Uncharacterized protein n=1 Tax=Candidatus Wolfebacteria bacterium GW2011_GWC2_39_22 TaxID=1619013 RepID=A0A0G0REW3_9BACT|nr:MAG: hypothetical protein UT41_C0003G0099 [Candidatus Wolfebacteria bacterium GW2011_GWC2_39_22]
MKSFITTVLFFLVTTVVVGTAFAAPSTAPQQAGAYYVTTGAITPEMFKKVEAFFQKMHPTCPPEKYWVTYARGFGKDYRGEECRDMLQTGTLLLTWDGRIEFKNALIGRWDEL